jgi:hypothetical protein
MFHVFREKGAEKQPGSYEKKRFLPEEIASTKGITF